ncbi:hypothetical protein JRO89_XS13G0177300 [Xanthoceras sorbifolium]|uniref:RNA polymerase II C-terminal domain phosphatase-like n=1 Tax=Xanthoceras sorbifolium TaxID=99658 RepID=A0ABQ8H8W0_9ROSI|nr:hypothetical protein JRO89_XS13G0177300 [Xanthoceras sorbifolium]
MVAVIPTSKISPTYRKLELGPCSCKKVPLLLSKTVGESVSLAYDCKHSTVVNGLCLHCCQTVAGDYGVAFDYKKLHLVLDLDHTLLHTKAFKKLTPDELYLKKQTVSWDTSNGSLFTFNDQYLVKLRPFVRTFLKEASTMFEIYVCSMGNRNYVRKAAQFLDPEGNYFNTRLIGREDFGQDTKKKNLDLVLGQERGIVIVDDTESVWTNHLDNLITVEKYIYFVDHHNYNRKSHAEMKTDESENDGQLVNVLGALRRIHGLFFDSPTDVKDRDIRCFDF